MTEPDIVRLIVELVVIVAAVLGVGLRVGTKIENLRTEIALGRQASEAQAQTIALVRTDLERVERASHESRENIWRELSDTKQRLAVLEDRHPRGGAR